MEENIEVIFTLKAIRSKTVAMKCVIHMKSMRVGMVTIRILSIIDEEQINQPSNN